MPGNITSITPRSANRMGSAWLVSTALAACAAAAEPSGEFQPLESQLGLGPLQLVSQSPGQSLRLGLVPHTPAELSTGDWRVHVGSTWVNVWSQGRGYELDYEALASEVLVAHGIDDSFAIEVGAISRVTFGGAMDGFIQGFHDLLGMDQNGRDEVEDNRNIIRIDPTGTQQGVLLSNAELRENRRVFVRVAGLYTISRGGNGWPAISLSGTLQAPIDSSRSYTGGLLDVSLDLSIAKALGNWVGYASVAWTRFGADNVYGINLHRSNWAGLGAVEYRMNPDWSLLLQYLVSQGVAPDLYAFSKPSHEVVMGTQVRIGKRTTFQLGLIENVFIFDNSPDFGVHLAVEMRF
jgi:hypothetical protein